MNNIIEILPNIYGVKIDADSTEIQITHHTVAYKSKTSTLPIDTNGFSYIEIGLGELRGFKILGFLTKDEISFDASEIYKDTLQFHQYSDEASFRSALPEEIYFEHPEGDLKYCCSGRDCGCLGFPINIVSKEHWEEYQNEQQNITEKLLILQKL